MRRYRSLPARMVCKYELPDCLLTTWKAQRIANNQHVDSTVFPPGSIFAPTKDSADHFLNAEFRSLTLFRMTLASINPQQRTDRTQ
ncbi:hypothetical protein [uncultured Actinomyces sp.]|uniref:hypothetical protein n=1 Tax=uncultured Actinomyces sp. TaxID=249061 RepID=UPI0028F1151A|nr:hypothetical protein [uncultured Actinomyces sp.]